MVSRYTNMNFTLLLVDDISSNIFTLRELLKSRFDINIKEALNGEDALKIALEQSVNLILLDVRMPKLSGFDVASMLKLRKKTKDIPIIFITAEFKEIEHIREGFELGGVDYMTKPFDEIVLFNKIYNIAKIYDYQQKLIQKEAYIKAILDAEQDYVCVSLNGCELDFMNMPFLEFLGFESLDDLKSSHSCIKDFFIKDDKYFIDSSEESSWVETILNDDSRNFYVRLNGKDRDSVFLVKAKRVKAGKRGEIVVTFSDIGLEVEYQNRLQNEVEKKREEIENFTKLQKEHERILQNQHRLRSIHELLINISHHWRQPLNDIGLQLYTIEERLEDGILDGTNIKESIKSIYSNLNFLSETITRFQGVTKVDKNPVGFYLKRSISDLIMLFQHKASEFNIDISLEGEEIVLKNRKSLIINIMHSLIENSIDSLANSENRKREIKVDIKNRVNYIVVTVSDNGVGIAKEQASEIFNPYYTTKFKSKGVGLSLYLAKKIAIDDLKGELHFSRSRESGAEFILEFPKECKV